MAYITLDFKCDVCRLTVKDELIDKADVDSFRCPRCGGHMSRMLPATRTDFRFADTRLKK